MKVLALKSQLALQTRCENQIENEINREAVRYGDVLQVAGLERQYPLEIHRPIAPSRKYNCHGLSFASRRTWIDRTSEIRKIISDDEYQEIHFDDILPGDIAIYWSKQGDAEHSGIVVEVNSFKVPIVLSKWGPCHEVVHHVARCPYDIHKVSYYRIKT